MKAKSKETKSMITYSWKFWCAVSAMLAAIVVIIVLAVLSIKAAVQNLQILLYENKVEGTVTVAEYWGEKTEHGEPNSTYYSYKKIHYIITFDHEIAGCQQYEYTASNVVSTKKYVGDRYLVLFRDIEKPLLIQKGDILADNVALLLLILLVGTGALTAKKWRLWLHRVENWLEQ